MEELSFEALNNTKFVLPQSEILERSEVRCSEASLRELYASSMERRRKVQDGIISIGVERAGSLV